MKSRLDKMDELAEEMRATDQRLASLEQDVPQPRLAMESDMPANKKTRERTEGAATAVQAMHGIAFLRTGSILTRKVLPASVMAPPDLRLSCVHGMMPW